MLPECKNADLYVTGEIFFLKANFYSILLRFREKEFGRQDGGGRNAAAQRGWGPGGGGAWEGVSQLSPFS